MLDIASHQGTYGSGHPTLFVLKFDHLAKVVSIITLQSRFIFFPLDDTLKFCNYLVPHKPPPRSFSK